MASRGAGTSSTGAADAPAVTLLVGPEAFLRERGIDEAIGVLRAGAADLEVSRLAGADVTGTGVAESVGPSLFGGARALVVPDLEAVPTDETDHLVAELSALPPGSHAVLSHAGGTKGQRVLKAVRPVAGREIACQRITRAGDVLGFVKAETRRAGGRIDDVAARRLVEVLGSDLRSLASAAEQLAVDADGPITADVVSAYFDGRTEVKGWAIADLAVDGEADRALPELRWALATGTAPVLVVGAVATSLRTLARLQSSPSGTREADLARELGVPEWKLRTLRRSLRGWRRDTLASAIQATAEADRAVKGEAADPVLALSRLVVRLADLRAASLAG